MSGITGFFHGGITVRDMERSLAFYRTGLGLEVEFDRVADSPYLKEVLALEFEQMRVVYLRIPNTPRSFVELLEYTGVERQSAAARPSDYGGGHLCLYVDDVEAIHGWMLELGFTSRSPETVAITAGPMPARGAST